MKLSLNSLNIEGGSIINFNEKLIKLSSTADDINYSSINVASNSFSKEDMKSLKTFINFVLPYISYKGKPLGLDAIKNIETLYGDSFAITLVLDDFIMKVSRSGSDKETKRNIKEISNLEYLFDKTVPVPDSLNEYLGFISGYLQLKPYSSYKGELKQSITANIFNTRLFTINEDQLMKVNKYLGNDTFLKSDFLDDMVIIFFKKEDMSLADFIEQNKSLTINEKLSYAFDILQDLKNALNFLHKTKKVMHCDIKPDNIVVTRDLTTGKYKFKLKLISFESIYTINEKGQYDERKNEDKPRITSLFYQSTLYVDNISYLYDYHCLIFSILNLLGIYNINLLLDIYNNFYNLLKIKSIHGEDVINFFIEFINTNTNNNNFIKLPKLDDLNKDKDNNIIILYKYLFSLIKITSLEKYTDLSEFYK
jgi:serine/threonine protein kinase